MQRRPGVPCRFTSSTPHGTPTGPRTENARGTKQGATRGILPPDTTPPQSAAQLHEPYASKPPRQKNRTPDTRGTPSRDCTPQHGRDTCHHREGSPPHTHFPQCAGLPRVLHHLTSDAPPQNPRCNRKEMGRQGLGGRGRRPSDQTSRPHTVPPSRPFGRTPTGARPCLTPRNRPRRQPVPPSRAAPQCHWRNTCRMVSPSRHTRQARKMRNRDLGSGCSPAATRCRTRCPPTVRPAAPRQTTANFLGCDVA